MFKLFKRLALIYILIFLLLVVLVIHSFRPELVNVDRYTIILFAFLFVIAILPSLQSGKISYFFEFKRDLEKARESVNKLTKAADIGSEAISRAKEEADNEASQSNACLACGWLRQKIYNKLKSLAAQNSKNYKYSKPLDLLELLKKDKYIDSQTYKAIKDVLALCQPDKPYEQMDEDDLDKIMKIGLPLVGYLDNK
jgi:hypothetical protein